MPFSRHLFAALLLAAAALPCTAAPAPSQPGERFTRRYDEALVTYQVTDEKRLRGHVMLDLKMAARLWTLMGEPVVYCSVSWKLRNANVEVLHRDGKWKYLLQPDMPPELWKQIEIISATVAFPVAPKGLSFRSTPPATLPCDIGVANANGDARGSFNVPGSPNWAGFMLASGPASAEGRGAWNDPSRFISAASAKALMKQADTELRPLEPGYNHSDLLVQASFNFGSWTGWVDEQDAKQEAARVAERARTRKRAPTGDRLDPFEAMVQEVETEVVTRAARSDADQVRQARSTLASQQARRAQMLAHKGCQQGDGTATSADLDAVADRAEAAHALCAQGEGLVAYTDPKAPSEARYGYKRADGAVQIAARFSSAKNFAEGVGRVKGGACPDASTCFINAAGEVVLRTDLRVQGEGFSGGLLRVADPQSGRHGFINLEGRVVVPMRYSSAKDFKDGSAEVMVFLRKTGEDTCHTRSTSYFDVGRISASGDWVSGPREESERGYGQICLTRTTKP